jgi:hypothetical protein
MSNTAAVFAQITATQAAILQNPRVTRAFEAIRATITTLEAITPRFDNDTRLHVQMVFDALTEAIQALENLERVHRFPAAQYLRQELRLLVDELDELHVSDELDELDALDALDELDGLYESDETDELDASSADSKPPPVWFLGRLVQNLQWFVTAAGDAKWQVARILLTFLGAVKSGLMLYTSAVSMRRSLMRILIWNMPESSVANC